MGVVAPFIPMIVAAVGTAATIVNQRQVAHKQDTQLAAQIRAGAQKQQKADALTSQLINKVGASTDTQDKAKSQAQYATTLAQHEPQSTAALTGPAAASQAFAKGKLDAALGVSDYGNKQADWLSSMDAPKLQRQRDLIQTIDPYKTDIGLISRENSGDNFLANMKLRGIQPNPWLSLVSGVAGGASSAMAKGGYGASDTAAEPYTAYNGQYGDLPDLTGMFKPPAQSSGFSYYPNQ